MYPIRICARNRDHRKTATYYFLLHVALQALLKVILS